MSDQEPKSKIRRFADGEAERSFSVCLSASTKRGKTVPLFPAEQLEAFEDAVTDPGNFHVSARAEGDRLEILSVAVLPDFLSARDGHGERSYRCKAVKFLFSVDVRTADGCEPPSGDDEVRELLRRIWWETDGLTTGLRPHAVSAILASELSGTSAIREVPLHSYLSRDEWDRAEVNVVNIDDGPEDEAPPEDEP